MPQLGVVFPPHAEPATLPAFATRVEELGYEQLWVVEDCFLAGGLVLAATALAVTERLRVGVGLMPAPMRNPALAAMEIGALARLHPGRFIAAFGHGVAAWMEQIGALPQRRLAALGEVTAAVRALLAGETVTVSGSHVHLREVALEPPPASPPPVLIGSTGPRGLALAGEVADGFLVAEGCTPALVSEAVRTAAGAAPAGRTPHAAVYSWLRIDDDEREARMALRPSVDRWLDGGSYPRAYAAAGVTGGALEPGAVPASLASQVALAGPADACAAAARRVIDAGVDSLVLSAVGPDPDRQYARFAAEVMPRLAPGG